MTEHPVAPELVELARLDAPAALARLASGAGGLAEAEAQARLARHGPNAVAREAAPGIAAELFGRLRNPLNLLLGVLAAISFAMGDHEAAAVICGMIVLSVVLAFLQEHRSSRAAEKLRAMVHTTASVLRQGAASTPVGAAWAHAVTAPPGSQAREIAIHLLVPGDVVALSAGDIVPADLRILSARDLFVNQAPLTGESLPVEKFPAPVDAGQGDPLQLPNICFMGTNVISGTATGVVALTGPRAYFGGLAGMIMAKRAPTSFDQGISRVASLMLGFIAVMAPLVFLVNGLTKGDWIEALLFAVAVAVGLTPEMLPMIVTVNLAKGALAMSGKKVIVKRLNAIQNFGAMDVLCADKTGTLTQDRVIVERYLDVAGGDSPRVLEYAYLNSYYQSGLRNLLDVAVLDYTEVHARLQPSATYAKVDEIPFDFQRRRMSVVVEGPDGRHQLICKGAVEEVFAACTSGEAGGTRQALDASHRDTMREVSTALNEDGFRVIAVAYRDLPGSQSTYSVRDEADMVLLGYVAFLDPPKESAREAISRLAAHGVQVKILTGDNGIVTRKVCRQVGMPVERVVLGGEVEACTPAELEVLVEQAHVFAKLTPAQKALIIEALHRRDHVVGFLGDGINDGPALRAADVGVSVDTAVDIARESADIILLEKSLLVLDEGVLEGRKVFGNIVKYIRMGASSNFGNMFSVIGASAWLPFLPMAPIQVLTNNLLYDFSQTAIPTDNVDEDYLARPRRWEIRNIAAFMLCIGPISSIFDYATFATMFYWFGARTPGAAALFQTGWFVESLLSQTLIIHVIRTRRIPLLQSRASAPLILATLCICAVGAWLPYSPLAHGLGFVPLPAAYWPIVATMLLVYLSITHTIRAWFHRRFGVD